MKRVNRSFRVLFFQVAEWRDPTAIQKKISGESKKDDDPLKSEKQAIETSQQRANSLAESFWRFTTSLGLFLYGFQLTSTDPAVYDFTKTLEGFPSDPRALGWHPAAYFMSATGYYFSQFLILFHDSKPPRDATALYLHHLFTYAYFAVAWLTGMGRMGVLYLNLHDIGDIFLDFVKIIHVLKLPALETIGFVLFCVVWVVTRLLIFPYWIHLGWSACVEVIEASETKEIWWMAHAAWYFGTALFLLHLYWTSLIMKIAYRFLVYNKREDVRDPSKQRPKSQDDERRVC